MVWRKWSEDSLPHANMGEHDPRGGWGHDQLRGITPDTERLWMNPECGLKTRTLAGDQRSSTSTTARELRKSSPQSSAEPR